MADRVRRLLAAVDAWITSRRSARIARLALTGFGQHDGPQVAASMAYFAILSLFQLVVLGVVAFSLALGEGEAMRLFVDRLVAATPLDRETVEAIVSGVIAGRGGVTVISVLLLAWGALGFFDALALGIGRAFPGVPRRPFWQDRLLDLLLMAFAALLAIGSVVVGLVTGVLTRAADQLGAQAEAGGRLLVGLIGITLPIVFVFVALVLLYRFVPNRPIRVRQVWVGALVGSLLWTVLRLGFSWYATDVAQYETLFGPISTAVGLLVFLHLASMVLLVGAEVARATVLDDDEAAAVEGLTDR